MTTKVTIPVTHLIQIGATICLYTSYLFCVNTNDRYFVNTIVKKIVTIPVINAMKISVTFFCVQ